MRMLTWDIVRMVVLAIPFTYYAMGYWLSGFAYQVSMAAMTFVTSGFADLIISLLTVVYQAIKIARANPVNASQYE